MAIATLDSGPDMARELTHYLDLFLARLPAGVRNDRRSAERLAIPLLLRATPIAEANGATIGDAVTGVGKDLSRAGLGLYHHAPLPHRFVRITFEDLRLEHLTVDLELSRCRFSNLGWYESGGRLLQVAPPQPKTSLAG